MALNLGFTSHSNQRGRLQRFGLLLTEPSLFPRQLEKCCFISPHTTGSVHSPEKRRLRVYNPQEEKKCMDIYTTLNLLTNPPIQKNTFFCYKLPQTQFLAHKLW